MFSSSSSSTSQNTLNSGGTLSSILPKGVDKFALPKEITGNNSSRVGDFLAGAAGMAGAGIGGGIGSLVGPGGAATGAIAGEVIGSGLGNAYAPEISEYGQKAYNYISDKINGYRYVGEFEECTKQFGGFISYCHDNPSLHVRINK